MHKFHLRSAENSSEQLIEITIGKETHDFVEDLIEALVHLNVSIEKEEDVFANDEVLFTAHCDKGRFQISIDNWGFAFIIAPDQPQLIDDIALVLDESPFFENREQHSSQIRTKLDAAEKSGFTNDSRDDILNASRKGI